MPENKGNIGLLAKQQFDPRYVYAIWAISVLSLSINSVVTVVSLGLFTIFSYILFVLIVDTILLVFLIWKDTNQLSEDDTEWGPTILLYYTASIFFPPIIIAFVYTAMRYYKIKNG